MAFVFVVAVRVLLSVVCFVVGVLLLCFVVRNACSFMVNS